ncbi:hypothetical protein BVY00_00155 [bacterium G20]|nr:hypothetical protein BVY00_00155 [bacterium G20]
MKIKYDKNLNVAGFDVFPWLRVGPKKWFNNYKIASFYELDAKDSDLPDVVALNSYSHHLRGVIKQRELINNIEFQELLATNLSDYSILYSPSKIKSLINFEAVNLKFLGASSNGSLENKLIFRNKFKDRLPIPKFKLIDLNVLQSINILKDADSVVLQHETSKAGKGTVIIRDEEDLKKAVNIFKKDPEGKIIVSEYIEGGLERSLQGCVTRYGIFIGPLQKQIIANQQLFNPANQFGEKFCGAEISPDDKFSSLYNEMSSYCKIIGQELASVGYKGVFGVDFLVSREGRVYVLETNTRLTGVTPLLSMLCREGQDIPFYLLHILELGNYDYEIIDPATNPVPPQGSILLPHSKETSVATINHSLKSGLYSLGQLSSPDLKYSLDPTSTDHSILLHQYAPINAKIKPGGRLLLTYTTGRVLDDNDELTSETTDFVNNIYSQINLGI